jgi:hypothetical protein
MRSMDIKNDDETATLAMDMGTPHPLKRADWKLHILASNIRIF